MIQKHFKAAVGLFFSANASRKTLVERPLSMREVPGSIPGFSKERLCLVITLGLFFAVFVVVFPHLSFFVTSLR